MSWIINDLWSTLGERREEYVVQLENNKIQAFETINKIAFEVGRQHGVVLQLNFPPGHNSPGVNDLGHRNISLIVNRVREKFDPISEVEAKRIFDKLRPRRTESMLPGREGFRVQLSDGRIDCLPGAVHLWCEITPGILEVLDQLLASAYGLNARPRSTS